MGKRVDQRRGQMALFNRNRMSGLSALKVPRERV
jgi:hypothetical protein